MQLIKMLFTFTKLKSDSARCDDQGVIFFGWQEFDSLIADGRNDSSHGLSEDNERSDLRGVQHKTR